MEEQNPTSQIPNQDLQNSPKSSPAPTPEPKQKKSKAGLIVGVVVLLILFIGAGVYWWTQNNVGVGVENKNIKIKDDPLKEENKFVVEKEEINSDENLATNCNLPINLKFENTNGKIVEAAGHKNYYSLGLDEEADLQRVMGCYMFLVDGKDLEIYKKFKYNLSRIDSGEDMVDPYEAVYNGGELSSMLQRMKDSCLELEIDDDLLGYAIYLQSTDTDKDGVNMFYEYAHSTFDDNKDSDNDGLNDLDEIKSNKGSWAYHTETNGDYGKYVSDILTEALKIKYDEDRDVECYLEMCNSLHWQEGELCRQNVWPYYPDNSICDYTYAKGDLWRCEKVMNDYRANYEKGNPAQCFDSEKNQKFDGEIDDCLKMHIRDKRSLAVCEIVDEDV